MPGHRQHIPSILILLLLSGAMLHGCSEAPAAQEVGIGAPVPPPAPRPQVRHPGLLDGDGVPHESDVMVAGLTLPVGLTVQVDEERRHRYSSVIDAHALLRYFGPRLTTMEIEHEGSRVSYRNALPREVRGGAVRLDVTIQPTSSHPAVVEIVERLPPPPEGLVIPPEEIRRHLNSLNEHRE